MTRHFIDFGKTTREHLARNFSLTIDGAYIEVSQEDQKLDFFALRNFSIGVRYKKVAQPIRRSFWSPPELLALREGAQNDPKVTKKGEKWPPTREKLQITQKSIMKALFCSRTHTKTYSEEFSSRGGFCRVVRPQNTLK